MKGRDGAAAARPILSTCMARWQPVRGTWSVSAAMPPRSGLEIEEEQLPAFRQAVNAWAAEHAPRPKPAALPLDAAVTLEELTLEQVQQLQQLAPFGRENPTPVLLVQDAVIDGVWAMGAEGRHTRVRLRQGRQTLFASLFGVPPQKFAYPVGTPVEAALEVSVFSGRSGPMVSAHLKAIRPAGLGNLPSEQAAWFEALCAGRCAGPRCALQRCCPGAKTRWRSTSGSAADRYFPAICSRYLRRKGRKTRAGRWPA